MSLRGRTLSAKGSASGGQQKSATLELIVPSLPTSHRNNREPPCLEGGQGEACLRVEGLSEGEGEGWGRLEELETDLVLGPVVGGAIDLLHVANPRRERELTPFERQFHRLGGIDGYRNWRCDEGAGAADIYHPGPSVHVEGSPQRAHDLEPNLLPPIAKCFHTVWHPFTDAIPEYREGRPRAPAARALPPLAGQARESQTQRTP